MIKEQTYTVRAYLKLKHICETRLYDRYKGGKTGKAYSMMEKELVYVKRQGSAPLFIMVFEILNEVGADPDDYCLRGTVASSILSFLLDISDIDPIESSPKLYSEFCFGINGERTPSIEINVTKGLYKSIIRYFREYTGEAHLEYRHFDDGRLYSVRIKDPARECTADTREYGYTFNFLPVKYAKKLGRRLATGKIFDEVKPQDLDEYVKCLGFGHNSKWVWKGNARKLYRSGKVKLNKLIAHREDVYEFMLEHGIEKEKAFRIAKNIRKGRPLAKGWDPELLNTMQKAKVPWWYIESCSKISYLFPRAHDMMLLKRYCEGFLD